MCICTGGASRGRHGAVKEQEVLLQGCSLEGSIANKVWINYTESRGCG